MKQIHEPLATLANERVTAVADLEERTGDDAEQQRLFKRRALLIGLLHAIASLAIGAQLFKLQVIDGGDPQQAYSRTRLVPVVACADRCGSQRPPGKADVRSMRGER